MSKYVLAAGALLFLILCLAGSPERISAATPTPTETLRPVLPTATSSTLYLRPTPTPFIVYPAGYSLQFIGDPGEMADSSINFYRFMNRDHLIDLMASFALALTGISLLIKAIRSSTENE